MSLLWRQDCTGPGEEPAYPNYIDPSLANWRQAYYGANYARLTQVKAAYDPHRLFNFPQAV